MSTISIKVNERYTIELSPLYEREIKKLEAAFKNPKFVENWKTWSAELKSGKYNQCKSKLKGLTVEVPSYCCLGIACNIAAAQGQGEWSGVDNTFAFGSLQYGMSSGVIPVPISNNVFGVQLDDTWFYISSDSMEKKSTSFQGMNDYFGLTFEEIAKVVDMIIEHMTSK